MTRATSVSSRSVSLCAMSEIPAKRAWCLFPCPQAWLAGSSHGPLSMLRGAWGGSSCELPISSVISLLTSLSLLSVESSSLSSCLGSEELCWDDEWSFVWSVLGSGGCNVVIVVSDSLIHKSGSSSSSVVWIVTLSMYLDSSNIVSYALRTVWVHGIHIL